MNMKRMRGRNQRGGGGGGGGGGTPIRHQTGNTPLNRNHVFDSQGPDLRLRGTSQQLFEKYLQLGRDASSVGDRVMAEGYFQHAEHYFRILGAMQVAQQQAQPQQAPYQGQQSNGNANGNQQRRPYPQQNQQQDNDEDEQESEGEGEQPQAERFVAEPRDIPIADTPPDREAHGRDGGRDSSPRATQDSLPLDRDRMEREPRPQQQVPYEARQDAPQQPREEPHADLAQPSSLQDGQPGHDQQTAPREEPVADTPPPQPRTRTREPRVPRRERPQPTEA